MNRCEHGQTPVVVHLQRGFAVLGIAGVGCYALLRGWLRAKQADLPEMQKVSPCHCADTAQSRSCWNGDLGVNEQSVGSVFNKVCDTDAQVVCCPRACP